MAKKTSAVEAFIFLASKLPWWASIALAAASGMFLHALATAAPPTMSDVRHLDTVLTHSVFSGLATFGQFFVPVIFVAGAVASIFRRRKRSHLLNSVSTAGGHTLLTISWHDFELLVGEALRRRGYAVQETGANGPDGGVDLVARKDGETYLVQCKQWRSIQVGVPVVRELYGAMAAEGAVGGFVVTSGRFSKPARAFASGRNVQLIDGEQLKLWIAETKKRQPPPRPKATAERVEPAVERAVEPAVEAPTAKVKPAESVADVVEPTAPACPFCKKTMVTKLARTGKNAGGHFWGCVDYPKCRGIRPQFAPMKVGR